MLSAPFLNAVFFAQASAAAAQQGSMWSSLFVMGLFIVGMYFLMIAPQRKKQKEHEKMLSALRTGDEVVTTGGIFGTITNVKEDRFVLKISDTTKVEIGKGFISSVLRRDGEAEKK
ncbi:MAG TPA: preprotein translocase subunit YajC [Opitutaceae bacterium]|jgi:preprotein translocase subunit YajC|nr:preprotein translocase subunit YajC [Opitutaceae bacterium]